MGDFNHRLLFSLLFSGNFFWWDKVLMEKEKVVIVPPVPPPEKILTGALSTQSVCPLPLKYYKSKIFKHLTYR